MFPPKQHQDQKIEYYQQFQKFPWCPFLVTTSHQVEHDSNSVDKLYLFL